MFSYRHYKRAPKGAEIMEYAGAQGAAPFFGFEREGDVRNHDKATYEKNTKTT